MIDLQFQEAAWMDEELRLFSDSIRRSLADAFPEERLQRWRDAGIVEREAWNELAAAGLLGLSISPEYGGTGGDIRHEAALTYQLQRLGADGFGVPLHNGICAPYIEQFGTEAQKRKYLPGFVNGQIVAAIAMTEPGAGSDLRGIRTTARKVDGGYLINGQKVFISNGQTANLIIVAARTADDQGSRNLSLFCLETENAKGFRRGRNLDKVGVDMGDTSELFFDDVLVPDDAVIGGELGNGLKQLMKQLPKERLLIAIEAQAIQEAAIVYAVEYAKERRAFNQRIFDFQNTQFKLAECLTEARVARAFINECVTRFVRGDLDAASASMAKYWISESAQRIVDTCQQVFGGYGYMNEYPIARLYRDVRVKRVYGGANEVMKVLIAREIDNG